MTTLTKTLPAPLQISEVQARWATPRRPDRATLGPRVAEIARRLRTPLMPWQQQVADVGLEIDPETGHMAYREVICTVMRQNGKTSLVLPIEIDRCIMWDEPQRVIYTAQTGSDARKKLLEDQVPVISRSGLSGLVKHIHRAQGNENIYFKSGSRISVMASAHESGHGFTVDVGVLDECWNDEDDRREQALLPGMSTRPDAQLILASTMGTEASVYLNRKVEAGRHAATVDKGTGIAYFEWSIPKDADIENPAVWREYMPALGRTISESAVAHAFQTMEEMEWRRAYGNQMTQGEHDRLIPDVLWQAVNRPNAEVARGSWVVFGIDVLPERDHAAIVASDGITVELIDHRPGTGWLVERVQGLQEKWRCMFAVDGGGPAASVAADLEAAGIVVERMGGPDMAAACATIYDAIADHKVMFREDESLDTAVAGLARRPIGDKFVWSRATSLCDITPFVAATIAYDRAVHGGYSNVEFLAFN